MVPPSVCNNLDCQLSNLSTSSIGGRHCYIDLQHCNSHDAFEGFFVRLYHTNTTHANIDPNLCPFFIEIDYITQTEE